MSMKACFQIAETIKFLRKLAGVFDIVNRLGKKCWLTACNDLEYVFKAGADDAARPGSLLS